MAMLGATLLLLRVFASSRRVIGWILVAAVLAGLLHPVVSRLQRRMRRGLAVALVMVALVGSLGAVAYGLVDDLVEETRRLQQAAPERAAELERSERFGSLARDLRLVERTQRFVDEVPARLRGGTPAEALRAAATRGVAFLATGVLTIFLLLHGPDLARAAREQVRDETRRRRLEVLAVAAYHRSFGYARRVLAVAAAAGLTGYLVADLAEVPGPAPLGMWVALWDLVPVAGAFVGALPIVGLAAATSPARAATVAAVFLAYQVVENVVVQRRVEDHTLRLGPFLTIAAGLIGLELSGLAGALLLVLAAAVTVAALEELAAEREREVFRSPIDRTGRSGAGDAQGSAKYPGRRLAGATERRVGAAERLGRAEAGRPGLDRLSPCPGGPASPASGGGRRRWSGSR
jgi:predicted PurR-regulated permease PerM